MSNPDNQVNSVENTSGVPYGPADKAVDTVSKEEMTTFNQYGRMVGTYEGYGAAISDQNRLFYSTREPVAVWWVKRVAYDIWDNGFRVIEEKNKDSHTLDNAVQKTFRDLEAVKQLTRSTVFERRYGTSILLLSYTGFGSEISWETPLYMLDEYGKPPKRLTGGKKLLQVTPYPLTSLSISEINTNPSSIRCGLPEYYTINVGSGYGDSTNPQGATYSQTIRAHWTRVILDAPRIDEHPYLGVPAIDEIWDDLVGARNTRWAAYESYYRHGTGFPVVKFKGTTAEQNRTWLENGGLDNFLHVRGCFICNTDESFEFAAAGDAIVDPNKYFDMHFTFISAATGVAKDTLQGVSAGRVTGSESNERQYFKSITLQQNQKEPVLRELIDRLIQTGQVEYEGEYEIEWIDPFEVNPQDKASIEFLQTRTRALKTWKTINELRAEEGLPEIEGGDVLMSLPGQMVPEGSEPAPNQKEASRQEQPNKGEEPESTLLDKLVN